MRLRTLAFALCFAVAPATALAQECPFQWWAPNPFDPFSQLFDVGLPRADLPPECTSPLMRSMYDAAWPLAQAGKGNTSPAGFATYRNDADAQALIDGRQVFPAMARAIEGAKHEVDIQTFAWVPSSDGAHTLLGSLKKLEANRRRDARFADPPVQVNIAVDADPRVILEINDSSNGAELRAQIAALHLDPALVHVTVKPWDHLFLGALHSKTTVVDGRIAIVTGSNPQPSQNYDPMAWNDAGYVFRGAIAGALRGEFADGWGEKLPPLPSPIAAEGTGFECRPMLVLTRDADGFLLSNGTDSTADRGFLALFANAQREIHVQTPNFNDDAAQTAVIDAVARGTTVKLVLSQGFNDGKEKRFGGTNVAVVGMLQRALEKRGVRDVCKKLQVRWYSANGLEPVIGNGFNASHAKFASADGQVTIVGSSNMDTQSWNHSREVDVAVDDASLTKSWDGQVFGAAWKRGIPAECGGQPK